MKSEFQSFKFWVKLKIQTHTENPLFMLILCPFMIFLQCWSCLYKNMVMAKLRLNFNYSSYLIGIRNRLSLKSQPPTCESLFLFLVCFLTILWCFCVLQSQRASRRNNQSKSEFSLKLPSHIAFCRLGVTDDCTNQFLAKLWPIFWYEASL